MWIARREQNEIVLIQLLCNIFRARKIFVVVFTAECFKTFLNF